MPFSTFLGVDDELLLRLVGDEGRDGAAEEQHGGEGDPKDVGFCLVVDVDGCRDRSKINQPHVNMNFQKRSQSYTSNSVS